VIANGSANTVAASAKATPCLVRLRAAFRMSHSNSIDSDYRGAAGRARANRHRFHHPVIISPQQQATLAGRFGDPFSRPAACHARHVRRCLQHRAAAAVASTSSGVDSTTHGEPLIDATREQTQPPRSMLEATPATSARAPASPLPAIAARRPTQRPPIRPAQ
jgi:alpha-ketoglutarate-dependent taurine dioxygenase